MSARKIFNKNSLFSTGIPLYDCAEILESGYTESGLYRIDPGGRGDFTVFCDMNLLSGGWTVIQRRVDGKINFDRDWRSYRNGFGAFDSNFWLGLNKIKRITDMKTYELYIGLEDHYNDAADTAWARYGSFSLGSEEDHYKLYLSGYDETSPAGDSLDTHNGQSFSTVDEDNDLQCAQTHKGGWWYKDCIDSNLNGVWYADGTIVSSEQDGIIWQHWTTEDYSLKTTVMAIRAI